MRTPLLGFPLVPGALAALAGAVAFGSVAAADDPTPRPGDPVIIRADVVYDRGPALCPNLVRAPNGDLLVQWSTRGDGMPGQATQVARSSDGGQTWSEPYVALRGDEPLTGSGMSLYALPPGTQPSGRLLCYTLEIVWPAEPDPARADYLSLAAGRRFDSTIRFTTDDGKTFSAPQLISDPIRRNDFAQGPILALPNGHLLWPWGHWEAQPLNGFRRSTDGGKTWGPVARAWQDPPPGQQQPLAFNETAATVCRNGDIVAVARVDTLPDKRFWLIRSSDGGTTWSPPRPIELAGGSPALTCTPRGQLWLAYRDAGVGPGLALAVSDDHGEHWRFLYHLRDPKGEFETRLGQVRYTAEDLRLPWRPAEGVVGYPSFAWLSDTDLYVAFHLQAWRDVPASGEALYVAGNLLRIPPGP